MISPGALTWYIPDAYLPQPIVGDGPYVGHEAICILNVTDREAAIKLDFYFEDQPPAKDIAIVVGAERTRHVRLDRPEQLNGFVIPTGVPYAIRLRSVVPVIVQYSRLDTTQVQCTLMTTMAHPLAGEL